MAEKATLMLEAAKKSEEIKGLEASIAKCSEDLETLPKTLEQEKQAAREKSLAAFNSRQEELRKRVSSVLDKKRQEISDYLDSVPGMESREFAGKMEVNGIEDQLKEVYPEDMVMDYLCTDIVEIDDPEYAFSMYAEAERDAATISNGSDLTSKMFNSLTDLLVSICNNPTIGAKAIPIVLIFYMAGALFFPFVFLTSFALLGVLSASQGWQVKQLIIKLYSVKMFLNQSYNEDIFNRDKGRIMRGMDKFFHDVRIDYEGAISQRSYSYDTAIDDKLDKKYRVAIRRAEQDRDLYNSQLQKANDELKALLERIDALDEEERKRAENAQKEHLETVTWKREWLEHVFVDVNADNRKVMMPFTKGHSCYFSKDIEQLKEFSRLTVMQCVLHMHPDFASQAILDYKYMGGGLTQFLTLGGKAVALYFTEEDIAPKVDNIDKEIMARTKNILASSQDLDSFNSLMATYGATGEFYVIVHLFGLESISSKLKNWLRNGLRVGYIFKIYATVEELVALGDSLPFEDISDFFEIGSTISARSPMAVKRRMGKDS